MTRTIGMTAAATALGLALTGPTPAWATGGSFHCERPTLVEASDHIKGSFALLQIVTQYAARWDAQEAMKQCRAYAKGQPYDISCLNDRRDWDAVIASVPKDYFGRPTASLAKTVREERRAGNGLKEAIDYCRSVGAIKKGWGVLIMATYITEALTMVDAAVASYAETVFTNFAGPLTTSIRLAGVVTLALLGANAILAWVPIKMTDLLKWGMRYTIVLMITTSWTQFLPFYDIITNVPGSIGAALLDQSGVSSLNEAMDNMVTGIFDSSENAADQSGFILSALISFGLMVVGALMATVAIVVSGIGKIGIAMAVSLAPIFIACLLFRATSDLFSTWCKFTLGFAMIPLVLAGVMGVILGIGEDFLLTATTASTMAEAASFLIVAMAAIFLMSQVPTMVNGLAGTVVATASGTREARQMAGTGVGGLKGGAAAGSALAPAARVMGTALRAGAQAEPGGRGTAIGQELINAHVAHKKATANNRERLASLGRRSTLGSDFTSGQAGMEQHARRRWNELKSEKT